MKTNLFFKSVLVRETETLNIKKALWLFIICFILGLLNDYIFDFLNERFVHFENETDSGMKDFSTISKFILVILVAPICETLLAQYGIYSLLTATFKLKNYFLVIIVMSLFFGAMHCYHWIYMVATFFGGLILNYFYLEINKSSQIKAVMLTTVLHAFHNLYWFVSDITDASQ